MYNVYVNLHLIIYLFGRLTSLLYYHYLTVLFIKFPTSIIFPILCGMRKRRERENQRQRETLDDTDSQEEGL